MKKNLANMITISRMIGTAVLIFLETLSNEFFLVYLYCGLSDIADGMVARKTDSISPLGSKLDSASDLFLYTVMMLKIMKYLKMYLPVYVWILIYTVLAIRALCYLYIALKKGNFLSRHTIFNKMTGLSMFFLPFVVNGPILVPFSLVILVIAYTSTFEEILYFIRDMKNEESVSGGVK